MHQRENYGLFVAALGLKELPRTVLDVRIVKWTSDDDRVTQLYVRAQIIYKTNKKQLSGRETFAILHYSESKLQIFLRVAGRFLACHFSVLKSSQHVSRYAQFKTFNERRREPLSLRLISRYT